MEHNLEANGPADTPQKQNYALKNIYPNGYFLMYT